MCVNYTERPESNHFLSQFIFYFYYKNLISFYKSQEKLLLFYRVLYYESLKKSCTLNVRNAHFILFYYFYLFILSLLFYVKSGFDHRGST